MEGSESRTKKSKTTAKFNRANFENARKIFFGTKRIPGTDRGRWTTASHFRPKYSKPNEEFKLGPHLFKLQGMIVYVYAKSKFTALCKIEYDRISILFPNMFRNIEVVSPFQNELSYYGDKNKIKITSFGIDKTGKVYLNHNLSSKLSQRKVSEKKQKLWSRLENDDLKKALEIYKKEKETNQERFDIDLQVKNDTEVNGSLHNVLNFELKDGVTAFEKEKALLMIASDFGLLKMALSAQVPESALSMLETKFYSSPTKSMCEFLIEQFKYDFLSGAVLKKRSSSSVWFTSDLHYIANAIDWLMHVLTGPDERTYESKKFENEPTDEFKESSEPKLIHYQFKEKGLHDNFVMSKTNEHPSLLFNTLVFGVPKKQETKEAKAIRDLVVLHLSTFQGRAFAENFAKFREDANTLALSISREAPYSWYEFQAALVRLQKYKEHQFLGCNVCGTETKYRCSTTKVPYCGIECQMIATKLK